MRQNCNACFLFLVPIAARELNYLAEFQSLLFLTCKMATMVLSSVEREMASQKAAMHNGKNIGFGI